VAVQGNPARHRALPWPASPSTPPTLAQAFAIADELNAAHGRWGRRACVYAIDPDGLTHFVDPALRPAP
jgi:hypothetical protein